MKKLSVSQLAEVLKAEIFYPPASAFAESCGGRTASADAVITDVSTDTRTLRPGDCFFALTGNNFDGHNFVNDAFEKGAACAVVCSGFQPKIAPAKPLLNVTDTVVALGELAGFYRNDLNFKVVAVTGSVGKTTTRQIIYNVLSHHFKAWQSPKNYNNQVGLPLTLLAAPSNTEIVVAELGANKAGEISYLSKIASPDVALITNVYPAHLEGFGSIDQVAKEKASIADGLKAGGMLIINADFPMLLDILAKKDIKPLTFGLSPQAQIRAENIIYSGFNTSFTIEGTKIELPLPGQGNVFNTLAAWAVCRQFGAAISDFAESVATLKPVDMRSEILQIGSLTVINDCYNANPASMKNALQILSSLKGPQTPGNAMEEPLSSDNTRRLVFICGDMNELGKDAENFHQELGRQIAQANVQLLIAVGSLTKFTAQTAKQVGNHNIQVICTPDSLVACNILKNFIKDTDIILVKGSRIARLELAVEKLKELFMPQIFSSAPQ
jgi:UDP-N-acetylmuramoyl-tripeptide--D-alanyl-D-alanine ligase